MTTRERMVKFIDFFVVEGNDTLGMAALVLYYVIMYFAFHDSFVGLHLWSFGAVLLHFIDFAVLGVFSYRICEYSAKRFLHDNITIRKVFLFSLTLWVLCVPLCLWFDWMQESSDSVVLGDHFYVRLMVNLLVVSVMLAQSCCDVIKQRNEEKLQLMQELKSEQEKVVRAQLNMLKLQLDPHFMFNSLGTLSDIILESPQKALDFTSRLARIYKYIVAHISDDTISLHEGMDFIHDYCQHLVMRYKDNFLFEIEKDIWHDEEEKILPLSLQLLVENAVKHNQHSVEHPLHIRIFREGDFVCVSNQLVPYEQIGRMRVDSMGIGIKNLYDRYKLLTDKLPIILQSANTYTVQIPIVKNMKNSSNSL